MALQTIFAELESYTLTGVQERDEVLGHGSYATVLELEYMGLKCAGKKIHEVLLQQGDASYIVRRFEEECRLLSQVRHPNIVQFLGVHFQKGVRAPILVMEFLPTNLTACIDQYGILPRKISYSILHDVALGLHYLHSQTPPIIHRDLSSNNVLLTPNMTAKISDLGMARIFNLTPLHVIRMTQTPGTPAYMPPEVMIASPRYDTSVDVFSYGILMIHTFSGRWPEPQVGPTRIEADKLIPVTEAERREGYLRAIESDDPLLNLTLRCINNDPQVRPASGDLVKHLAEMVIKFPSPMNFVNQMELMRRKEAVGETRTEITPCTQLEISKLENQGCQSSIGEMEFEVKHLQLLLKDMTTNQQALESEKKALEIDNSSTTSEIISLKQHIKRQENLLKTTVQKFEESITHERNNVAELLKGEYKQLLENEKQAHKKVLQREGHKYQEMLEEYQRQCQRIEAELFESRKVCSELKSSNSVLRVESLTSTVKIESLESTVSTLEERLAAKEMSVSSKDSELEAKTKALKEKDDILSGVSRQLTRAREYLATKQQILQAKIDWTQCADLPITLCNGKTVIIDDSVYFRGMCPQNEEDDNVLLCYSHVQDRWTALPPLPVKWFGLGKVNGMLIAVGGLNKHEEATNNVYTLNVVQKWKPTLPSMPTARCLPGVLSLKEMMIVAGGYSSGVDVNTVEILKFGTMQWCRTSPLPTACREISMVSMGNTCYAVGGYRFPFRLNQALCASISDLIRSAVPASQTTLGGSSVSLSVWNTLPHTPSYRPAAAVLAGSLLAIGGGESSIGEGDKKEVYIFSPSTNSWIYISDLPAPRSRTTVAVLSSTEILVIGGVEGGKQFNTVYKGTLQLVN